MVLDGFGSTFGKYEYIFGGKLLTADLVFFEDWTAVPQCGAESSQWTVL